ncbi:hypothetical protein Poli38472_014110 [Pythium oligandrum]|uniref:TIR domain-containing protein n=1 Tax=Pythium oligandrum TaxID=41045 RepID=A0A8K1CPU0_PYTOL|nr:hypothetical protein Poli38472_014110 [Pythium oligandrum]|eukprot:TMW66798.1 hypothetical protein Poli38472_014110 [Pythium oligandrum]
MRADAVAIDVSSRASSSASDGDTPLVDPPMLERASTSSSMRRRAFRRHLTSTGDPCLLSASFESWSEYDHDETDATGPRQLLGQQGSSGSLQRSLTMRLPPRASSSLSSTTLSQKSLRRAVSSTVAAPEPMDPLLIRVRKVPSEALLKGQSSSEPTGPSNNPEKAHRTVVIDDSFVLESDVLSHVQASAIRDSRSFVESVAMPPPAVTTTVSSLPPPPRRWWIPNARARRWYGKLLNSYFGYWLVVCSAAVVGIQLITLLVLAVVDDMRGDAKDCNDRLHSLTSMNYMTIPTLFLVLPVVFPSELFGLYDRTTEGRLIRRPYLQLCEVVATGVILFLLYFAAEQIHMVPVTSKCHKHFNFAQFVLLYAGYTLWFVLGTQIFIFVRFLSHLKLQADGVDDATHTSTMSKWIRRLTTPPTFSRRRRQIKLFKKLLYRAVARGDLAYAENLFSVAPTEYGIHSVTELYTPPTLWLYAFARSSKNPLHVAAMRGHLAMVQLLIREGFDVNVLDKVARVNFNLGLLFKVITRVLVTAQDGFKSPLRQVLCSVLLPPLHGAVAAGHLQVVRELLEHGADVDALPRASFYYRAAVLPAIFVADDPQVLRLLVSHGANFLHVATTSLMDRMATYATPLQRSAFTQRSAITEYLLECGADVALTPLHSAAAAGNKRQVKRLLMHGTHVDALGERVEGVQQRTPLHWAAIVGQEDTALVLLKRGATVDARDRYGRTPLHWAARNNHAKVVAVLLNHNADPMATDNDGVPVLSFAAEADGVTVDVVASLLAAGADARYQHPESGDTALHIALQRENRATAMSLIKCGSNMMLTNYAGRRAVDCTTSTELQFALKKEAGSRDVMISYTHSHFAFAQQVREYLEEHCALTCWMDTMDPSGIGGGAVWREEIARGIHNCSLVLSIVCGGYTKSEWCLKELAFAKFIHKPVLALIVEEGAGGLAPLDALVPQHCRVPFNSFITEKHYDAPRRVRFDVDEEAFAAHWGQVLPLLMRLKATARRLEDESPDEEEVESEERTLMKPVVEEEETKQEEAEENETQPQAPDQSVVLLYSPRPESTLCERLQTDLQAFGFASRVLTPSKATSSEELLQGGRMLIVLLETPSDPETTATALTHLTLLLRAAETHQVRVVPIVVRSNFLSFSNLYTLARSQLLYFVEGVGYSQSMTALLRHLREGGVSDSRR